jgi:hypothetical protein
VEEDEKEEWVVEENDGGGDMAEVDREGTEGKEVVAVVSDVISAWKMILVELTLFN